MVITEKAVVRKAKEDLLKWASIRNNFQINERVDTLLTIMFSEKYSEKEQKLAKFEATELANIILRRSR